MSKAPPARHRLVISSPTHELAAASASRRRLAPQTRLMLSTYTVERGVPLAAFTSPESD